MSETTIYLLNLFFVGVFGMILSAAYCDIQWTKLKVMIFTGSMAAAFLMQGIVYFKTEPIVVKCLYPFITHLPLAIVLCILSRKVLWPVFSVLTAYLCCQTRRWLALLVAALCAGDSNVQNIAELVLTLPLLVFLLRYTAPSVRALARRPGAVQLQFGLVPAVYYGFDYLTSIYSNLLLNGVLLAVEFMPFVCSVAYIVFVSHESAERRIRSRLEQTQDILNLQVAQAIREIHTLRESHQTAVTYRHDLRHHLQYISSCIENGQLERAQGYIREIYAETEAGRVKTYCENESANLIFSAFAERAEAAGVSIHIEAGIPKDIAVSESDLCVLLSNALENALHACQKRIEEGLPGRIMVSAYEKKGKLCLQLANTCGGEIAFDHDIPVTDKSGHGIGVRSICAIVERYGGIYSFSAQDGQFILRLIL